MVSHETNVPNQTIIAGLGNPGTAYRYTYHNTGFLFLDFLMKKEDGGAKPRIKTLAVKGFAFAKHGTEHLVWPLSFMNESGAPLAHALRYLKAKPDQLLVVHDDSDLPLGNYRISFDRNAAGHHGIESIIQNLRTKKFWRLRIGIRPKSDSAQATKRQKAKTLVMKKISNTDTALLKAVFENAAQELGL